MKASVITPNFNGMKFLKTFLKSIKNEYEFIEELIIIDNGSNDDSVDFIKKISNDFVFPIRLIENSTNLGFSKAINQGINLAISDYVFLVNNDTEIQKGAIKHLINCLNSQEDIFSVSSKMVDYKNRNIIDDAGDEYNILGWTKKAGNNQSINTYNEKREIFSSCAGAALYRKSIFNKIGLFDEDFFAYMEDVDICYRAQIFGFRNYYCPDAIVFHIGSGTTGSKYNEFKVKIAARNNIWLIYKNFPIPQKIFNFGFLFIGFLIKYLFFVKKGFGNIYLDGIKEGLNTRDKINKIDFKFSNTKNYFKIEWKLIINTLKLFKK